MTAAEIFTKQHKTPNIMTPNLVRYDFITPTLVYELSWGTGMYGEKIYGVTFVEYDSRDNSAKKRDDLSKGGINKQNAEAYIKAVIATYNGEAVEE